MKSQHRRPQLSLKTLNLYERPNVTGTLRCITRKSTNYEGRCLIISRFLSKSKLNAIQWPDIWLFNLKTPLDTQNKPLYFTVHKGQIPVKWARISLRQHRISDSFQVFAVIQIYFCSWELPSESKVRNLLKQCTNSVFHFAEKSAFLSQIINRKFCL
jgi:hypothetical protein